MGNSSGRLFGILFLVLIDGLLLFFSFYWGSSVVYGDYQLGSWLGITIIILTTLLSVYLFSGYVIRRQLSFIHIPGYMSVAVLCAGILISTIGYITKLNETDIYLWRTQFSFSMLVFCIWLISSRVLLRVLIYKVTEEPHWGVIGSRQAGEIVSEDFKVIYGEGKFTFFESLDAIRLETLRGIIVLPGAVDDEGASKLIRIRLAGTRVFNIAEFYERFLFKVPLNFLRETWFATSAEFGLIHHDLTLRLKRLLDVLSSLILLGITLPLMMVIAFLVFIYDRGPVLYNQIRVGVDGKPFRLYKFRTMIPNAESEGKPQWTTQKDERITGIGNILRVTRIDELPQLWNVLRGDMSFIGPRPERPEFVAALEKAVPYYQYRHVVKPGITGWAQVMFPYGASEEDAKRKLEYDLYYIRHFSMMLDIFIFLKTIRVVLFGKGR